MQVSLLIYLNDLYQAPLKRRMAAFAYDTAITYYALSKEVPKSNIDHIWYYSEISEKLHD